MKIEKSNGILISNSGVGEVRTGEGKNGITEKKTHLGVEIWWCLETSKVIMWVCGVGSWEI